MRIHHHLTPSLQPHPPNSMATRPDLLQWLRQLDELDTARSALKPHASQRAALSAEIEALRQRLPTAILKHYDQRRSSDQPATAPVRGGICGGCHTPIPPGRLADLRRNGGALHLCENCGAFIYPDDRETQSPDTSRAR